MDGWLDGWMDGWMDVYVNIYIYMYLFDSPAGVQHTIFPRAQGNVEKLDNFGSVGSFSAAPGLREQNQAWV